MSVSSLVLPPPSRSNVRTPLLEPGDSVGAHVGESNSYRRAEDVVASFEKEVGSKERAFVFVAVVMFLYACVEIGLSILYQSLALMSDGLHNLSDAFSVAVGFWGARAVRRRPNDRFTWGFGRGEIVAAFANAVALLAVAMMVALDSVPKFLDPKPLQLNGLIIVYVAGSGLLLNLLSTVYFACLGVDGHGHGHSHSHSHGHSHGHSSRGIHGDDGPLDDSIGSVSGQQPDADLNVRGMIIHFFSDVLSSILLLVIGLLLHFVPKNHAISVYVDPVGSLLICLLIVVTSIPLVRSCAAVLLERAPRAVPVEVIGKRLLSVPRVRALHDFHVWQIGRGEFTASVHLSLGRRRSVASTHGDHDVYDEDESAVLCAALAVFHQFNVHATTIQLHGADEDEGEGLPAAPSFQFCPTHCREDCDGSWYGRTFSARDRLTKRRQQRAGVNF